MNFVGQTFSYADATIQPRVSGYLLEVLYGQGMPVRRGELLFRIDPAPLKLQVMQSEAAVAAANSQLVEAQSNYDRSVPLARLKAISQSSLDQATAALESAKANKRSADAALDQARLNLSYTSIYASIDGVIGKTNGTVGDYVGVGTNYPILNTISNLDSVYVYLSLPVQSYLSMLERDSLNRPLYYNNDILNNIKMILADGSIYPHPGRYSFTERDVNNSSGSVVMHIIFPNKESYLKAGQYVRVSADVGPRRSVVLVPQRAVNQSQGINSLLVMKADSTVEYRRVELGDTYGSQWAVTSGVGAHEKVLIEGSQKLRSGMKITPLVITVADLLKGSMTTTKSAATPKSKHPSSSK